MRLPRTEPKCLNSDSRAVVANHYNLLILDLTNKETHSARKNDINVRKCTSDLLQSDHSSRNRKVTVPVWFSCGAPDPSGLNSH